MTGWAAAWGVVLLLGCARDETGGASAPPEAEQLRARYPYQSMAERLKYEQGKAAARAKADQAPPLTREAAQRLETLEKSLANRARWDVRLRSLKLLHSGQVAQFIKREGNGRSRMVQPSPEVLPLLPAPPIPVAAAGDSSAEQESGMQVKLAGRESARVEKDWPWPTADLLARFHETGRFDFFNLSGFGHIKDRDHVAGFQSHHFRTMPALTAAPARQPQPARPKERWVIRRLELVSLLKHEKPAVYVSDNLPRMEELRKGKTRPLTAFEKTALKSLRAGEDLEAVASTNRLRMLGALRAAKQCLDCHQGQRGELLGAFSYELKRIPPLADRRAP